MSIRSIKRLLANGLIAATVAAAYLGDAFAPLERGLASLRFQLMPTEVSGEIIVVGIDRHSLQALNVWPWPREYHARLVDRLVAAGASRVALDIDFSSHSTDASDEAFEASLARAAPKVILATFKQPARDANGNEVYFYTTPIPRLARHSRLGHVNVQVESDSLVWRYEAFEEFEGVRLPGMATLLAQTEGAGQQRFTIDFAIRPETLPYISYVDVLQGNFDPADFRGKTVIVGATALELGDRIPVPVHQVLPGPIVQALIADTVIQGRGLGTVDRRIILAATLLIGTFLGTAISRTSWQFGGLASLGIAGSLFGASVGLQYYAGTLFEFSPIALAAVASYLIGLTRSIDRLSGAFHMERLESLYRRAMMNAVVDSNFNGIAIADRDGRIEMLNPSACRILNCREDDVVGELIHRLIPRSPELDAIYGAPAEGTGVDRGDVGPIELSLETGEGVRMIELVVTSARLNLERSGKQAGEAARKPVYIYTFRDVTERKRTEEMQVRARKEAEAASRAKTEFLANMSHELRTPLNAIIGLSDIIKRQMMGPIGIEQYLEYVRDINASGQHLLDVVNDILDMSKIESGEMTLVEEEIEVPRILASCVRIVDERARAAELSVAIAVPDDLPRVFGDERMIKQMLLNLLTNSVKFTPEGGTITASAELGDNGGISFRIRDTGIGIPREAFERIFEPFGQADASLSREFEGTGLGLPLVKSMIELHGGTLGLESTVGSGTTVTLSFPPERTRRKVEGRADEAPAAAAPAA